MDGRGDHHPTSQLRHHGFQDATLRLGQWAAMPDRHVSFAPRLHGRRRAQRCGTTSMYRYLVEHPGIRFPRLTKGTHWFDEESQRSDAWYRSNFPLDMARDRAARRLPPLGGGGRSVPGLPVPPPGAGPDAGRAARCPADRRPARPRRPGLVGLPARVPPRVRDAGLRGGPRGGASPPRRRRAAPRGPRLRHFSHQHHGYVAPRAVRRPSSGDCGPSSTATAPSWCSPISSNAIPRRPCRASMRFLGLPPHPTVAGRRWNRPARPRPARGGRDPAPRCLRVLRPVVARAPRRPSAVARVTGGSQVEDTSNQAGDDAPKARPKTPACSAAAVCFQPGPDRSAYALAQLRGDHHRHPAAGGRARRSLPRSGGRVQHPRPVGHGGRRPRPRPLHLPLPGAGPQPLDPAHHPRRDRAGGGVRRDRRCGHAPVLAHPDSACCSPRTTRSRARSPPTSG